MRRVLLVALWLAVPGARCDAPGPRLPPPDPRPGDSVRIRGRLGEDVDCRLLRAESGKIYSLSDRLSAYRNGARVCIHGVLAPISQCLRAPSIEVEQVRPWSSCP